jgi:hypothetical protein
LVGTVQQIGAALQGKVDIKEGDRVIPIYSLSSIPLKLTSIDNIMGTTATPRPRIPHAPPHSRPVNDD